MYTIVQTTDREGSKKRVDLICDTVDDLPTMEEINKEHLDVGSFAYIANDRTYKVLNNAKEWV